MKRFMFSLERVRKWRQDEVELEEMRLQRLYAELRACEEERRRIDAEAEACSRSVLEQPAIAAEELATLEDFRLYAARQARRLEGKKREVTVNIGTQRNRVVEAHRRCKLLDGLRDRALLSWTADRDKEQEDLAAELYLAKRNRDA